MIVTAVSVSMPAIRSVYEYAERNSKNQNGEFRIHFISGETSSNRETLEQDIVEADVLITDIMGAGPGISSIIVENARKCNGQRLTLGGMAPQLGRLGKYDEASFRMNSDDEKNLRLINEHWKIGEYENIEQILNLVLGKYLKLDGYPETVLSNVLSGVYIKNPNTGESFKTREEYRTDKPVDENKGTVSLVYSGNNYPTKSIGIVRALYDKLIGFCNVTPIAMNSYDIRHVSVMEDLIEGSDLIINLLPFRFMAGPMGGDSVSATDLLKRTGATLISPFYMSQSFRNEWEEDVSGVNPMEFMLDIFLPELDGSLCTLPVGAKDEDGWIEDLKMSFTEILPIDDRIDRIVNKTRNYLNLRNKPNSEKKIAILSYNYPSGEGSLFGGSFLDGAGSISSILDRLNKEGYSVDSMSSEELLNRFINDGILNNGQWISPSDRMIAYKGKEKHPDSVTERWGVAPGKIMVSGKDYMIPGIINNNVFIGLQPPRTSESDNTEEYHDIHMPPHHQYLAMYEWIINEFKADAVIHLGTHGTIEFLPGKEVAMSSECFPDSVMGDAVHIYIYYSGNPSEAMIAKRRTHACLVSYMPPPFVKSGIYGEMVELEEMIGEYRESSKTDEGRSLVLRENLTKKAEEMRLPSNIDELEEELISIRKSLIPKGLHRVGVPYEPEDAINYAVNALSFPHEKSRPLKEFIQTSPDEIDKICHDYIENGKISETVANNDDAILSLEYGKELLNNAMTTDELEGLVNALNGKFVDVKPGGDPMKNPEIFPTGYNIVQFNPDHVPTVAAFERGTVAADDMISKYLEEHENYPKNVALILWGLETSRTQGMTIGQICGYLGLKLIRTSGNFIDRFEVIPLSELGRPRIDVTVTMCGFFRDMFPNLIGGLGDLFSKINSLDESEYENYHKMNTRLNREYLSTEGYEGKELEELSECRLFGPAEGEYGTSITDRVSNSSWENEEELGDDFHNSLKYAYTRNVSGKEVNGLLQMNHKNTDMVSQVRDSADRELIDLDHYYEFLGGLTKAVQTARGGERASVFVVDASGSDVVTHSAKRSIERGVRTRLLNPKWIDGLLEVKYHGGQKINQRFENVLGLAATVGDVDTGVFSDMLKCYVEDEDVKKRIQENNNWAYMSMLNRLFEAHSRGYWNATEEELEILRNAFLESYEGMFGNFVKEQSSETSFTVFSPDGDNRSIVMIEISENAQEDYENRKAFIESKQERLKPMGELKEFERSDLFAHSYGAMLNFDLRGTEGGFFFFTGYKDDVLLFIQAYSTTGRGTISEKERNNIIETAFKTF